MSEHNGTRVHITIDNFILFAALNDTSAAKELLSQLPVTLTMTRSGKSFIGELSVGQIDETEMRCGWTKGDIGYSGDTLTIFCSDAPENEKTKEMIIGHINSAYINTLVSELDSDRPLEITICRKR